MNEESKKEVQRIVREEVQRIFAQHEAVSRGIKQRHLEGKIIFFGVAADRPDGTTEVEAYFSTDTNTLNLWNGTAWVQEIFT